MGLGLPHLILILAVLLLFFGPSRLPGLGKGFGDAIRGFKKAMNDDEIDVTESSKRSEQIRSTPEADANDPTRTKTPEKDKTRS
jgi:TatA/E family protein of Tat protein translocase